MSRSSLPDIFRNYSTTQMVLPRKQGGIFTIINNNTTERSQSYHQKSRGISTASQNSSEKMDLNIKSMRSHSELKKHEDSKQPVALHNRKSQGNLYTIDWKNKANIQSPLQQIYNKALKSKGYVFIPIIPEEHIVKISFLHNDFEEADSLNNNLKNCLEQSSFLANELQLLKKNRSEIKFSLEVIKTSALQSLEQIENQYIQLFKQCYSRLSFCRRETNQQTKLNKINAIKIKQQINVCKEVINQIIVKEKILRSQTIEIDKSSIKPTSALVDFHDQISSIRKSSRGLTGQKYRAVKKNNRKGKVQPSNAYQFHEFSEQMGEKDKSMKQIFMAKGKQLDLNSFVDNQF